MSRVHMLRGLVVVSVLLHFYWILAPTSSPNLSSEAREALRWSGYGGTQLLQHPLFYWGMAALKLLAAVGLVLLLPWGRWLLALLLGLSLLQLPFNGIAVGLPSDSIIGALTGLVDGALLALAFAWASAGSMASKPGASPAAGPARGV